MAPANINTLTTKHKIMMKGDDIDHQKISDAIVIKVLHTLRRKNDVEYVCREVYCIVDKGI